ncbi:MAG: nucleotidyltransferase family protein [Thermoplasmataceae archaeon]
MEFVKICAAVLASGTGTRFGEDKIAALIAGKQLVCYPVDDLAAAGVNDIMLIVRPDTEAEKLACKEGVKIVRNTDYREGMASAIRTAVRHAGKDCDGLLLVNGDMPFFGHSGFRDMISIFMKNTNCIVSATLAGTRRNPAIFPKSMMDSLLALTGEDGGRKIMALYPENVVEYAVRSHIAVMDIDTKADLDRANSLFLRMGQIK